MDKNSHEECPFSKYVEHSDHTECRKTILWASCQLNQVVDILKQSVILIIKTTYEWIKR